MRNRTRGMVAGAVGAAVAAAVAGGATAAVTDGDGRSQDRSSTKAAERSEATQGDLDGDGYADLGVGAPEGTVSGEAKAGYVAVTYGAESGVDTERHSTLTQASPGVPGTPEAKDGFGSTVVTGDVDGDGYADLVVAANNEAIGSTKQAGSVTVVFGAKGGLSDDAIAFHSPKVAANAHFGDQIAVGDHDNDGIDDIAISDREKVQLVKGAKDLRETATPKMTTVTPPGGGVSVEHLASGDIDGDGYTDLVTVAAEDSPADEGTLGVLPGSADGLKSASLGEDILLPFAHYRPVVGDINGDGKDDVVTDTGFADGPDEQKLRTYPGTADGLDSDEPVDWEGKAQKGEAIRLADFDGDGHDDLVVSDTRAEAPGGYNDAGAVNVLKGTENWLTDEGAQTFSLDTEGVPGSMEGNDKFGTSVSPADYNGDGKPDLAVGIPNRTEGVGAAALLYAGTDGLSAEDSALVEPSDLGSPATKGRFGTELMNPAK
ncbi:FG-GAP-like repeat-containing protein [Streptomyces xiaopingdaonensis]|uniref:FG-GAP-like repeat-containing protein n=1 Tax=Streptomyces xiaopingdaonensis TaxID=1565415 RepID=UPI001ED91777|nr:FG-GAP-like repeat-containing protein [Streptomyces xiaopingdaonensis]